MSLYSCTGIVLPPVVHYVRMPPRSETAASVEAAVVEKTLSHTDVEFRFQRREDYKRTYC